MASPPRRTTLLSWFLSLPPPGLHFHHLRVYPHMVYGTAWHVLKLSIHASIPYVFSMIAFLARHPRLRLILVDT